MKGLRSIISRSPASGGREGKAVVAPYAGAARWTAGASLGLAALFLAYAFDNAWLMPGPLKTGHQTVEGCKGCHATVGDGRFGWMHALVKYADPQADSATCLTCHTTGKPEFSPHGATQAKLTETAERQKARRTVARAKPVLGDTNGANRLHVALFGANRGSDAKVYCATCHKEHQGTRADLTTMSGNRCQTCHQTQFDTFDTNHPEFAGYPFRRRTRIKFDHARHFGEHFAETREKRPDTRKIPDACADCHTPVAEKNHMAVKPFAETCSACHLPQILGVGRATGPKGIALIALPGLDLETLREKKAPIGEWPELSEAEFTPFMRLLLSGSEERRKLLRPIAKLDLQDLSQASKAEIAAVTSLVWEIKGLVHALTTAKTSDIMRRIGEATGGGLSRSSMAKLLATMPRDVLVSAQRDWLPSLSSEVARRAKPGWEKHFRSVSAKLTAPDDVTGGDPDDSTRDADDAPTDRLVTNPRSGRWYVNVLGELVQEGEESEEAKRAAKGEIEGEAAPRDDSTTEDISSTAEGAAEEEVEADTTPSSPSLDAESWTEFGGWYRKDFAILYSPKGHSDAFVRAWLDFSGSRITKGGDDLAGSVFERLTDKEAQGQCTKCHSIDAGAGAARTVQWEPSSPADKTGRFTTFAHEAHFRLLGDKGCLTCHELGTPKKLEASYQSFATTAVVSSFKPVKRDACATCHKAKAARQDCKLCHVYHVTPVSTPITETRLPATIRK